MGTRPWRKMDATQKSAAIEDLLSALSNDNRHEAVQEMRCIRPPIGCGKVATTFRDPLSIQEYRITGLCQGCQDAFYA